MGTKIDGLDESHALETAKRADEKMVKAMDNVAEIMHDSISRGRTHNLDKIKIELSSGIGSTMRLAWTLAEDEIESKALGRSFAVPTGFISTVSDFYSKYVPVLSSGLTARMMVGAMKAIQRSDKAGGSASDAAENVSNLLKVSKGKGLIIARTEGTRASSLARRAVAYQAAANGRQPRYFIYKSLLDGRTTHTCNNLNNVFWLFEDDKIEYYPPSHYFCRSGVIFSWELDTKKAKKMTRSVYSQHLEIQHKEFPYWDTPDADPIKDSDEFTRQMIKLISPEKIIPSEPVEITAAERKGLNRTLSRIKAAEEKSISEVKNYISNYSGNREVRKALQRELQKEESLIRR